ncbi:MAG TPA: rod shape-determining protein MreC [Rhodospirillales bacterium]|nr:rod shape-determining protein MreC [Rhodospirillales bacterium]
MARGPRSVSRLTQPIRGLAQRFAFIGLVAAAVGLMILGKVDVILMDNIRAQVTDAVAPILEAVSRPADSIAKAVDQVRELAALRKENVRLRLNEAQLLQWQAAARRLEAENKNLRDLLNFVPGPEPGYITARVIADTGGAFVHSLILNAGARDGVAKGQAAMTGEGLVGRVAGVGSRSARILLITDLNSRIPVLVGPNRTRAILAGNNSDNPKLIHLPSGETVSAGDRVVTSGHGGALPPELPVGIVTSVNDVGIGVLPFVQRNRLEYIRLLDFGLAGILSAPSSRIPASGNKKSVRGGRTGNTKKP